jgi:hypothetical protein
MYIHGIYVVYPWKFLDIPSFLKPDFAAGPCCWSHSMRTNVWVIKNVLFHAPPWQLCQGKLLPTKGSTRLQPTSPLCRLLRQWRRRRRWFSRRLSVFLVLLRATPWILVKDGAKGAFRAGDQGVEQLDACLRWNQEGKHSVCKGRGSCSSDEPERLDWMLIAIKLNSELSLSPDQKTANTWQHKVTMRTISYWYIVETHSIPDKKEVESLTDLNVEPHMPTQ